MIIQVRIINILCQKNQTRNLLKMDNNQNWISNIINKSTLIKTEIDVENQLIDFLISTCYENENLSSEGVGILFAAAFDLLVSAEYYTAISHSGWFYCPDSTPRLFFPYTNCCPRHALRDEFYFHPSNKPTSGKIGTATSRLLLLFYQAIFRHNGMQEVVMRGTEPVDAVILNQAEKKVLFAEIKASPLLNLTLATSSERLTTEVEGEIIASEHETVTNANLYTSDIEICVPKFENNSWREDYFSIGHKRDEKDLHFGFTGLLNLLKSDNLFFKQYFAYWNASLKAYHPKANKSIFWLTNACGTPNRLPLTWHKRRVGAGYESISDSKTSVGMDRTDDIKKGIYQVLKLGVEGKPNNSVWDYKVGIISNIHAARHFEGYLEALKDVIWTKDLTGRAKTAKDLNENQSLYNLFDGIISLTQTYSRDEWIDSLFSKFR